MAYKLTLTQGEIDAIDFAGYRYGWSSCLQNIGVVEGDNDIAEHEAWELQAYIEEDTEEGRTCIPLAAPEFASKLWAFCDQIV